MRQHHTIVHGESLCYDKQECPFCSETFKAYHKNNRRFCSQECKGKALNTGEDNPNYNGGPAILECERCGEEFTKQRSQRDKGRFCSHSCKAKWLYKNGVIEPPSGRNKGGEEQPCSWCGNEIYIPPAELEWYENHYCNNNCRAKHHAERFSGENHPNWKEDTPNDRLYQTRGWKETRKKALERDGYECQVCGSTEQLEVHHIQPVSDGGAKFDVDNTVTLCMPHHQRCEGWNLRPDTRGQE
jgi:hypothetical protein